METHDISYYVAHYSYLGIFIWFFIIDQLTPIPEELVLVTVGYLTHTDIANPIFAGIAALLGLMAVDNIYFYLTFTGNKWTQKLQQKKRAQILKKFQDKLQKHQVRTLLIIAFIPKVRFFGPILAGLGKMHYSKFFLVNMMGSLAYVSVYICLGFFFHSAMEKLINQVDIVRHSVFGGIILLMAVIISVLVSKWLSK
jgi:membrane protein DedA with SNARE-associated domain|tara:strand:- start:1223 stop:1813 length:591 start_codon:yes stop_codon:yes gene_type:complete